MSCSPELCATRGEVSTCTVREICPDRNAPFSPEAEICKKLLAECLVCLNFDHQKGECSL